MPILTLQRRMREVGRIRIGQQVPTSNGKTRPAKLDKFRLTSQDERVIRAAAEVYGGEARKWDDAPTASQWEVFTEATAIDVVVPPVSYAFSQFMELWSGGGCQRRCDGERMVTADGNAVDQPCVCAPDAPACKPHSRLSLILRDLEGFGVWRLDTQGWNAATELAGTIDVLEMLQGRGQMVPARLLLVQRESRKPGEATRKFAVPSLDLSIRVGEMVAAAAPPERPALTPIETDDTPAPSVPAQIEAHKNREPTPPRGNAQAALPPSGRRRSTPTPESDPSEHSTETGEITGGTASAAGVTDTLPEGEQKKILAVLRGRKITTPDAINTALTNALGRSITSLNQVRACEFDDLYNALKVAS